jgi:hypothetical protein
VSGLVDVLDQVYARRGWHGTTLKGALRGIAPALATWRPGRGRHNIWELALHAAYWKFVVRRRLTGDTTLVFPRAGADWPAVPVPASLASWRRDVALLEDQHRLLRQVVARFPASKLGRRASGSRWTFAEQIHGVIAHDAYHTGQIQLIKRLRTQAGTIGG